MLVEKCVSIDNVTYKAVVESRFEPPDDYYLVTLLRYTYDPRDPTPTKTKTKTEHWTPDPSPQWVSYVGVAQGVPIPRGVWPDAARDLADKVAEPDAQRVLREAIEEMTRGG